MSDLKVQRACRHANSKETCFWNTSFAIHNEHSAKQKIKTDKWKAKKLYNMNNMEGLESRSRFLRTEFLLLLHLGLCVQKQTLQNKVSAEM